MTQVYYSLNCGHKMTYPRQSQRTSDTPEGSTLKRQKVRDFQTHGTTATKTATITEYQNPTAEQAVPEIRTHVLMTVRQQPHKRQPDTLVEGDFKRQKVYDTETEHLTEESPYSIQDTSDDLRKPE